MPAVIDTPEVVDYEEHDLYTEHDLYAEQPQGRPARAGFWHTLVQSVRQWRSHRRHRMPSSPHTSLHQSEAPADLLARQYPTLYIQAFASV